MIRAGWCAGLALLALGCASEVEPDAYGNVEAIDVVVSAETGGRLVTLDATEGDQLAEGAAVGAIDAVQLGLERDRIVAERSANQSRVGEIGRQIEALMSQREAADSRRASLESERRIAERSSASSGSTINMRPPRRSSTAPSASTGRSLIRLERRSRR